MIFYGIVIGLMFGVPLGFVLACVCEAARDADHEMCRHINKTYSANKPE